MEMDWNQPLPMASLSYLVMAHWDFPHLQFNVQQLWETWKPGPFALEQVSKKTLRNRKGL